MVVSDECRATRCACAGSKFGTLLSDDRLLSDVLWAEAEAARDSVRQHSTQQGLERIIELGGAFTEMLASAPPPHAFVANEGAHGLALITSPSGGVRPRIVGAVHEIITEEHEAGNYTPPAPPAELAELADGFVSLVEHYLYADVIKYLDCVVRGRHRRVSRP